MLMCSLCVVRGCVCGAVVCGGGSRARPAADRVALRCGPASALAPFPVPGRSSLFYAVDCVLSLGGWVVLVRDGGACHAVGGVLRSGGSSRRHPPRRRASPSPFFVADSGGLLGWYPVGRDWWGGDRVVGGVLPRINIGANVWGESNIMTGVYERWCWSTLQWCKEWARSC
jgi:hypothetical protein